MVDADLLGIFSEFYVRKVYDLATKILKLKDEERGRLNWAKIERRRGTSSFTQ